MWFSRTEDYSIEDNNRDFYGPEITYGSSDDTSSSSSSSSASDWDTYQHEREYFSS